MDRADGTYATDAGATVTTEEDLRFAQILVRTHCAIEYPEGPQCLSCHIAHPCAFSTWATSKLTQAGWTAQQIAALDVRTGPWS